jgi:hypothetical protein
MGGKSRWEASKGIDLAFLRRTEIRNQPQEKSDAPDPKMFR